MVIEIDAGLRGIVIAVLEVEHLALAGDHRIALGAVRSHVHVAQTAAVHVVGALALVGSRRAAPQEVFTESHASILSHAVCRGFSIPVSSAPLNGNGAGRYFFSRTDARQPPRLTLFDTCPPKPPTTTKGTGTFAADWARFVSICNS